MVNPKSVKLSDDAKEEIKYLVSGKVENPVEFEIQNQRISKLYDIEEIKKVLLEGSQYALPTTIKTENTVYQIMKKLKATKGLEKVTFGRVKDTRHELFTKKGRVYLSFQFVLYIPKK